MIYGSKDLFKNIPQLKFLIPIVMSQFWHLIKWFYKMKKFLNCTSKVTFSQIITFSGLNVENLLCIKPSFCAVWTVGNKNVFIRDHLQISLLILTHFQQMFNFYTSWKYQKFSEIFRGYRSGTLIENGLNEFNELMNFYLP